MTAGGAAPEPPLVRERELVAVENLARTEALAILGRHSRGELPGRAFVLAGRALAGAAALAAARHLSNYGVPLQALLCGPAHRLSPTAAIEHEILAAMGLRLREARPADVASAVSALASGDALVDGSGDPAAAGLEGELARAARGATAAGWVTRLDPSPGYTPPAPLPADTIFAPAPIVRSREETRLYDSVAISRFRIPGLVLMENAGWRTAREAWAMLGWAAGTGAVLVLAGPGNNGGDGLVAARHLSGWGAEVEAVLVGERARVFDDARVNLDLAESSGLRVLDAPTPEGVSRTLEEKLPGAALVLDALLGTGLSGRVRGAIARAIEILNAADRRVLAVDTPSGLDANTGEVLGCAVRAERTVTFASLKPGLFRAQGPALAGEVVVADISLPRELWSPPAVPRA